MGIPDITKFVCRSAPSALCRVAGDANHTAQKMEFDFVLVDATNADQAVGIAKVKAFLQQRHLVVKRAIIFALDSERDRSGTSRHHKQTHLYVGNLDVKIQSLSTELDYFFREEQKKNSGAPKHIPQILMSGRGVAGEADYKILDMQRFLLTAALANKDTVLPTFLFISEDSDVLCGALCGPAPHLCSIATTLSDTLSQFCILSITQVLAYIGVCIDVFQNQKEEEEEEEKADRQEVKREEAPSPPKVAAEAPPATTTATTTTIGTATTVAAPATGRDDDVVRRKKVEGPVAFGNACVALSDSSDEDEEKNHPTKATVATPIPNANAGKATSVAATSTQKTGAGAAAGAHLAPPTPESLASAHMIHSSAVDLVFLFLVVMGNDLNVPSLLHGATKVDSSSCWHTYCNKKYASTFGDEVDLGHNLLHVDFGDDPKEAALRLDGKFLCSILETMHYADSLSRQPGWDEIQRAKAYLAEAVYATMRYIVSCNVESGAALKETFLDARQLQEVEGGVPTLASVLWLLHNEPNQRYHFSMEGLKKKDNARTATAGLGSSGGSSANATRPNAPRMQLDVGNSLVSPVAATTSWAVRRGGAGNNCSLASLVDSSGSHTARPRHGSSVAQLIKAYLGSEAPFSVPQTPGTNLFSQMERVWQRTLSGELPHLRKVALNGVFVSHVTGKSLAVAGTQGTGGSGEIHAAVNKPASVYSFELRRMTPVMTNVPTTAMSDTGDAPDKASTAAEGAPAPLSSQQRMMAALGLSLDYDKEKVKAPMEPLPSKRARTLMDEEEKKEFHRLEKISKKEGEQLGKRIPKKDRPKSDAPPKGNESSTATATTGRAAPVAPKNKKKRLGKKERLLMQKMKSGNKEAPKTEEPKAE